MIHALGRQTRPPVQGMEVDPVVEGRHWLQRPLQSGRPEAARPASRRTTLRKGPDSIPVRPLHRQTIAAKQSLHPFVQDIADPAACTLTQHLLLLVLFLARVAQPSAEHAETDIAGSQRS
jgi:hypothetical protein